MIFWSGRWFLLAFCVLFGGYAAGSSSSLAANVQLKSHAVADKVSEDVKKKAIEIVGSIFPTVSIDRVLPSSVPDWVVVASGDQLVYVNVNRSLIFQGSLIDEKKRVNLTDYTKMLIMSDALKNFPLEKNAIPFVNGNGSRRLVVFEDPYCKYCRVFTEEISNLTNATVYVVLYPIIKQESLSTSMKIWCSPDRAKAWHDWIVNSKMPDNGGSCSNPMKQNLELGHKYSVTGTPTIFMMTGQRLSGVLSSNEIDDLLG